MKGATVLRRRLAGVVFLLVPALLVWLSVAVYDKKFTDDATITVLAGPSATRCTPTPR